MSQPDTPATSGAVRFLGNRRAYWRLLIRGALLLMVTLGIYRFWLATDVRRFLWSNTEVAGETLEYSGTPLELLIGFLVAIAILIPVYGAFFVAALDLGPIGQMSGLAGFLSLTVLGQYAVYRARRYRLTRTVFRGIRFHQAGSAWRYALCAILWWALTAATLGLAYPWQAASLERYKMRHTYYGDIAGRFDGSALRLFLRGAPLWFIVVAPLAAAALAFIDVIDWGVVAAAGAQGGGDLLQHVAENTPGLADAIIFAVVMAVCSVIATALLYPVFQAVTIRWWASGLRFGAIALTSHLRIRHVYAAYLRFVGLALVFAIAAAIGAIPLLWLSSYLTAGDAATAPRELFGYGLLLFGYVVTALGFSTIYRATVKFSLWRLGAESLQMSGIEALERVTATGTPSSAVGEGLADALNVGGY